MNPRRSSGQVEPELPSCRALMRWIDQRGPMPRRLAKHVMTCPKCSAWASGVARVQGALTLLGTQAVPTGLLGRANDKALRMLNRQVREDEQAADLRQPKPAAKIWPRLSGSMNRGAAAAAAAMVVLGLRAGVASGMEQTRDLAQPLADAHYQRHIDDEGMLS